MDSTWRCQKQQQTRVQKHRLSTVPGVGASTSSFTAVAGNASSSSSSFHRNITPTAIDRNSAAP